MEREFLAAAHRLVTAAEARRRRRVTTLWRWLIAMSMALAAALAAGILVFIAWHDATSANVHADAARVGAAALVEPDLRRSLLLAVAADRLDPGATTALRQTLSRSPDLLARAGDAVTAVAVSPDGATVATGTADGTVWLRAAETLAAPVRLTYAGHAPVNGLAFTPDGRRLVSWAGSAQHPAPASVVVWDLATHRPDGAAFGQAWPDAGGGLLADATTLVLTQHDDSGTPAVVAWSLDSRTPSTAYDLPAGARSAIVSADGRTIAFATAAGTTVMDVASGHTTDLPDALAPSSLSPDGTTLLAVSGHDVVVWRVREGRHELAAGGHEADVVATAWSADGSMFASADRTGLITVWRAGPVAVARRVAGDASGLTALRFSPDARTLYTAGPGGLMAWDLTGTRGVGSRLADDSALAGLACALAGRELTADEWSRYLPGQPYRHLCPS